jgi:hypothetical protein
LIRRSWNLATVVLLGALVGCGDGRPALVPISGQVLIDGQPLTRGFVRFAATGNRPSTGKIEEDGRFTLTCYEAGDGAVVGTHQVAILSQELISDDRFKWHAPKKYSSYGTSGITQEITGPTDSLVIELTWGDEKPGR